MTHRIALILLLLCIAGAAGAAVAGDALPVVQPEGRYVDDDEAASYLPTPPGSRARFRQLLNAAIQNNPRNVSALAHRAFLFMEGGDAKRARRDYDAALAASEPGSRYERHVLWSRGWSNYDEGDFAATYADWQRAIALHGGGPFWAPYSLALLYWSAGQSEPALQWYATAAVANPEWSTPEGVAVRTRRWSPAQRERMQALFAAWVATAQQ
ncbi:tetratricopeptide repeat protein [Luteimonas sp. MC1782]|uniref:tetratricopeptide repeat protein n=1 Tax=Luteimonas sp. MC1782 TaxID=2760305 RepID=UPI0015FF4BDC|nr:tetratricopeptide repeat protein [Luteimonas sp. MC1782]MBB1471675.1 tetratricopeptide repeat protein [Luteimonas sp. MC1782]